MRIYSGIVLAVYVIGHLANHAFGLVSLDALNAGRAVTIVPWRTWPGTVILYGAVLTHAGVALWSLYGRRVLRFRAWEGTQLVLGLLVPFMLAGHVLATRMVVETFGVSGSYTLELTALWVFVPVFGVLQAVTLVIVWVHACIGFHMWLRLKPGYAALRAHLFAFALVLPTLALAGYVAAGVRVLELAGRDGWIDELLAASRFEPPMLDWVSFNMNAWSAAWAAIIGLVLGARGLRAHLLRRSGSAKLHYRSSRHGQLVDMPPGWTVLEALRAAGIRHASVCGGRGRCTTCRIRVGQGADRLAPASPHEQKALTRIAAPPAVRLACQVRPGASLEVTPLLPASAAPEDGFRGPGYRQGEERQVVILFADLRESTKLAEDRLPFDVLFVLNQFFAEMAASLEDTGGHYAQFNGDGLMALYGLDTDLGEACVQAMRGAQQMLRRLDALNGRLTMELAKPLRMGIGVHAGDAIVGTMGPPATPIISAIGDNVNIAARLEAQTKELGAPLVVSAATARHGNLDLSAFAAHTVPIRGRAHGMDVFAVTDPERIRIPAR